MHLTFAFALMFLLEVSNAAKKGGVKIDISSGILNPDPAGAEPAMAEYNTGENMYQGDILVKDGQKSAAKNRNAYSDPNKLWPQGTVPYILAPEVKTPEQLTKIKEAISDFNEFTCVKFVPRDEEEDYVKITSQGGGCYAAPGRMGGEQLLNLQDPGCWRKGTVIHEMLHALGFEHEHMRRDRDNYVTIHWQNIVGEKFNFEKMSDANENNMGFPYDYLSVLHYNSYAFGPDWETRTITTKQPEFQDKIGQRAGFSEQDIEEVKKLYRCNGKTSEVPGVNGCLDKEDHKNYCKYNDETHRLIRCGVPTVRAYCKKMCTKCDQPGAETIDYGTKTCYDESAYFCQETLGLKNGIDAELCEEKADYCRHSCKKC